MLHLFSDDVVTLRVRCVEDRSRVARVWDRCACIEISLLTALNVSHRQRHGQPYRRSIFGLRLGYLEKAERRNKLPRGSPRRSFPLRSETERVQMRLQSTKLAMLCFPPSVVAYGWFCEKHLHIAAVCVALFCSGFFSV
jgi:hypothetical protein